jgi:site-specific recombinase XerD/ribosomal protein L40E
MAHIDSRFHKTAEMSLRYAEQSIKKARESGRITEDDEELIRKFVGSMGDISPTRIEKEYYILCAWREFIGPYRKNTLDDIKEGIKRITYARKADGSLRFKKNTVIDYKHFIKRFYKWMIRKKLSKINALDLMEDVKAGTYDSMTKTAAMLLTEDEIKRMIECAKTNRNKALISCLYEGGFRVGELGNLQWLQVQVNDWNITINTDEKTGNPRYIPLINSYAYFNMWKAEYPLPITDDGYVFLTSDDNEQLQYRGVVKMLKKTAEAAGIEKHITAHIFRHTRVTELIRQGWKESAIKMMIWGTLSTKEFKTYLHLVNDDILREAAKHAGIVAEEVQIKTDTLEARQCPRCKAVNGPTHEYCYKCGLALTLERDRADGGKGEDGRCQIGLRKAEKAS